MVNTIERDSKPGLLVAKATVVGFDKPWSILIASGASGNFMSDADPLKGVSSMLKHLAQKGWRLSLFA